MDENTKDRILDNLTKARTVLVAVSQNTGFDGLAAGLALHLSVLKLGKNTSITAKTPSVGDAKSLYGVDKIGQIDSQKNLVVIVNDAVKNVDKVTYFLEEDKLKIVIHSLPESRGISKDQISFEQSLSKPDLIFAIGFSSNEDLKREITHEQEITSNSWIVNVNKDKTSEKFAQANINTTEAVTLSEMVAQIFQELALPIDEDIAYNLYAGIAHGTSNFSPAQVSPDSFLIASWLIKFGVGKSSLAQLDQKSPIQKQPNLKTHFAGPTLPSSYKPINLQPQFEEEPDIFNALDQMVPDSQPDWLKPPKIYKGSKSFDKEN